VNQSKNSITSQIVKAFKKGDTYIAKKDSDTRLESSYVKKNAVGEFEDFVGKVLLNDTTGKAAKKANESLLLKGIDIGELYYGSTSSRLIKNIVSSNPKTADIIKLNNQSNYILSYNQARELAKKEITNEDEWLGESSRYKWLKYVTIDYGDKLKDIINGDVILGVDKSLKKMVRQLGINTEPTRNFFSSSPIVKLIRSDDTLPKDIRVNAIVEILSTPAVSMNIGNSLEVLQAMGMTASTAMAVLNEIAKNPLSKFRQFDDNRAYSFNDNFMSGIDSTGYMEKNTTVISGFDSSIEPYFKEVAFMFAVDKSVKDGFVSSITFTVRDKAKESFLKDFLGRMKYHDYMYQDFIGDVDMTQ